MKSVYLEIDGKKIDGGEPTLEDLYNFQDLNKQVADKNVVLDREVIEAMAKAVALHLGINPDDIPTDSSAVKLIKAYKNLRDNIYECFMETPSKNAGAPAKN